MVSATPDAVRLAAPLAPNPNHRATVFGGSASALAILAASTRLHVRLPAEGANARLVIQSNSMQYQKVMAATFYAVARAPETVAWKKFTHMLAHKHRARIQTGSVLECEGVQAAELKAEFVAFLV